MAKATLPEPPQRNSPPKSFTIGPEIKAPFDTVTAAFFHQVGTNSDSLAARDLSVQPPREITYGNLARRSAALAHKLRQLGVGPGHRVPLVVKRGIDMLVGIVSVLTCGAQYVPLDGGVVPDSTLRFVLEQTGGSTVLALRSTSHRLLDMNVRNIVAIDDEETGSTGELYLESTVPQDLSTPDGGCYVIYTSGTTGTPKGVDVTHRNVTNLICLAPGNLGIRPGVRVGQILNISFDMAAWEMLGCLCNGGTLILRGSNWKDAMSQLDVLICTPSILAKYNPKDYPSIRTVATAGEPSSQRLADTWATHGSYYNCCGPTETTIVNTMHLHVPGEPLSIGKPTPNNNVYLLDEDGQQVGVGETGVMWAGGSGVTKGYVQLPEKTAEKYQLDPFTNDGSMMYNTGDLCRWRSDGLIDILGRCDDQIKIKGFRVELDGVTSSMNSCPEVDRASALLINEEIHGFIAPKTCDLNILKEHIKRRQPYYAVPTQFHLLDSLPLTANGKIDKKLLKTMASPSTEDVVTLCEASSKSTCSKVSLHAKTNSKSSVSSITEVDTLSSSSSISLDEEKFDLDKAIPEKKLSRPFRGVWHRVLIVYRRLLTLVGLFNVAAALVLCFSGFKREWLGIITAINLTTAVLVRQEFVINTLYTITCSVPRSWPLWIRARCGKIYHLGGVHSGAAIFAGLWLFGTNIADEVCMFTGQCPNWGYQSLASKVVSWMLSHLFIVMFILAWPTIRKRHHDMFEKTHRFVGWTMLGLFWVQVVLSVEDNRSPDMSLGDACIRSPPFWLLVLATMSIASSWCFLRKVAVESEVLSDHAIRLHFDYTVPVNGSFTRISRRPLLEWHSFATIPAPTPVGDRKKGYSLVVSNAGDWTRSCISNPPTKLWVRGVPTCGVMRIATLFNRVVLIATGSGIGPVLGHIQDQGSCATQLIWSTPQPEKTFGPELLQTIRKKIPDAVIHDTKVLGRPDLVKMGYNLAKQFGAEAVIIIANEKITKKVVYGLETRGVSAYGAIWDS